MVRSATSCTALAVVTALAAAIVARLARR
jgi:hypothetical protein